MPKNETVKKETPAAEAPVNERKFVTIVIPETPEDTMLHNKYFSVNGKTFTVPVGIPVTVPEEVAAAWEETQVQQRAARAAVLRANEAFNESAKAFLG